MAASGIQWYLWITLFAVLIFAILFAFEAYYWDKVYKQISATGTSNAGVSLKTADVFRWLSGAAAVILFVHFIWTIEKLITSRQQSAPSVQSLQSATVPLVGGGGAISYDDLPYCD